MTSASQPNGQQRADDLQVAQQLLRATLDSCLDMIQVFEAVRDEQGEIVDFTWVLNNHASEKFYGDVAGKSLLERQPGVVQEGIFAAFKQVVETGLPQQYEKHYVHEQFDGWFYQSVVKLGDGVATTTADITARKRAELEVQQSRVFLQSVIDSSLDVIQVFKAVRDETGAILDFVWLMNNQKAVAQNGEVIGKSLLELNPGVVPTGIFDHMVEVAQTGVAYEHEQYYHHEQFDGWFYQALVKTDDGVAMTTRDISPQKQAEQQVLRLKDEVAQQLTDKYQVLFNSIDQGFNIIELIFDDQGHVIDYWQREHNPVFTQMTGLTDVLNKRMSELVPDLEPEWHQMIERIYYTGEPIRVEYPVAALGQWYTAYMSRVGAAGSPFIACLYDDITERKRREKEQAFLLTLGDTLRPLTDPIAIEGEITQLMRAHVDAGWCYYVQWDEATKLGVVHRDAARTGLASLVGEHDVSDVPEFLELLKANPLLSVSDYENYQMLTPVLRQRYTSLGFRSMLVATLVKQERLVASLLIGDTKIRHWSAHEQALLMQVAERTWAAVERAKAEEALRQSESRLAQDLADAKRLQHFSNEVIHLDELNEIYELLLHTSTNLMQSDFASLQLYSEQTETLTLVAHKAFHPESAAFWSNVSAESGSVCGEALRRKLRILVTDVETEEFAKSELEIFRLSGIRAVQSTPIKSSNGKLIGMLNTQWKGPRRFSEDKFRFFDVLVRQAADFIEKRQAEEALRKSEEKYRTLVENLPDYAIFRLDAGGLITEWTEGAQRVKGYTAQEAIGQHLALFYTPDEQAAGVPQQELAEAAGTGRSEREGWRIHKNGTWFVVNEICTAIYEPSGQLVGFTKISRDITARKQAEEALFDSKQRLQIVMDSIADHALITTDPQGLITGWNTGAEEMFGYVADEALGQSSDLIFTPEDRGAGVPEEERQTARRQGRAPDERDHLRRDGSRFYVSGVLSPLYDGAGGLLGYVKVARDLSQRRQMEQALRVADQRKDEFLAMLAHELRNPLAPVRNGLQLLAQTHADDQIMSTLLPIMNRQMEHIMRMMDDLLDVSRISRGRIELLKQRIDLTQVVSQVIDAMQPLYTGSGRQLSARLPNAPLYLDGDATRLHQVVTNLLTNGLRYTHEGGQVWLTLEPLGEQALLRVADNGIGLAADQLEAIFELFVQVDTNLARSNGGLGLGLALVQQLVALHGGRVEAHSPGLEQGSEFFVYLPIRTAEPI